MSLESQVRHNVRPCYGGGLVHEFSLTKSHFEDSTEDSPVRKCYFTLRVSITHASLRVGEPEGANYYFAHWEYDDEGSGGEITMGELKNHPDWVAAIRFAYEQVFMGKTVSEEGREGSGAFKPISLFTPTVIRVK